MPRFNPDREPVVKHIFSPAVEVILTIVIVVIVVLFLRMLFKDAIQAIFSKKKSVPAMLASKVAEPYVSKKVYATGNAAVSGGVASGVAEKGMDYYFTFQLDDGKMITLSGPKSLYDVALEEGHGILTYKGKKFISYDGPTEGTKVSNDKSNYEFVGLNEKL